MANPKTKTNKNLPIILITAIIVTMCGIMISLGLGWYYLNPHQKNQIKNYSNQAQSKTIQFSQVTKKLPKGLTQVELATTPEQHTQGLMNRNELCQTCGMLFIYPIAEPQTFWMKNTFISLDIIFLDSDYKVINISQNTKTNQTEELYSSSKPAQSVLEVPSKWSSQNQITEGSELNFNKTINE